MTEPLPLQTANFTATRALKTAEWMAENAYIAPGFHRLLTAGGLTLGLWGGRHFMDVITARDATTGEEISSEHTTEIMRPLHGIMRYNPYSDEASDRWKFVVDRVAPVALGAFTAYWGGKLFFHGKLPGREPFFTLGTAAKTAAQNGKLSSEVTDTLLRARQSDATRKLGAATFVEGSAAGQHLFGALWPFNNGMIAVSFQQGALRNVWFPWSQRLSRALGNFGASSRGLMLAMSDTTKWMETNILKFDSPHGWAQESALLNRVRDGLQKFPERTAAQEQKIVAAFRQLIDDGYAFKKARPMESARKELYSFLSGETHPEQIGLRGAAFGRLLHRNGMDLSKEQLAHGPFPFFSRVFGSRPHELAQLERHALHLNQTFGYGPKAEDGAKEWAKEWAKEQIKAHPWKVAAAYGGGAAIIATGLAGAGVAAHRIHKESSHTHKPHINDAAEQYTSKRHEKGEGNVVDWLNGRPLDVAHWVSRVLLTPPSMHRFMNAAYLSAVLYGGMKFSNVLTGRNLTKLASNKFTKEGISESIVQLKDVWLPFKPLHGIMAYTPGSAAIQDRWRQATHFIMPVAAGMFGTYSGSYFYFRDRQKMLETPKTLEDYTDKISFEQSKFYAGATAITSIFNTGSGSHLLPIFNYSSNLHNRFLMGSGQQIAMPGLGKWWSGNAGTTPWGVKHLLTHMSHYLTYNTTARPTEMPSLVHSLIGKLYPKLSEPELLDKKQLLLDRIYDVRDSYLVEGHVPPSKQEQLGNVMHQLLSGNGLEMLLQEAALDPAKADLASNGASGNIANFFGKRRVVANLEQEYRDSFAARRPTAKDQKPTDFLRNLLDSGAKARLGVNDNQQPQPFAARVKTEPKAYPVISA